MTTYSLADVRAVCKSRDAWWTVLLVDPIACRLVRFVAGRTSITPNQITAVAFLLGMCSAACFSVGEWSYLALGAMFYHLGFIADCMDGKLARLKGNGTTFGLWLDFSLDQVRLVVCSFALSYGLYQQTGRVEAAYLAAVIIAFDLFRYLNGPQMAKVRKVMRDRLFAALANANQAGNRPALERMYRISTQEDAEASEDAGVGTVGNAEARGVMGDAVVNAMGAAVEGAAGRPARQGPGLKTRARQGLHDGFRARFPWYARTRELLLAHRIRTHLISGIEYQMAVFVIGPLMGPGAVPYTVAAAGLLLMIFESALVYKLWMSTRDFKRSMRRIEEKAGRAAAESDAGPQARAHGDDRVGTPLIG